jgi:hypothetical protein
MGRSSRWYKAVHKGLQRSGMCDYIDRHRVAWEANSGRNKSAFS